MARQDTAIEILTGGDKLHEDGGHRPMRADARRNYELLVSAAREVFAAEGGGASMEAIARRAGVGVGTLYRHFPKRIDVVEAVYRTDVDNLVRVAEHLVADLDPWAAVVAFLDAFVRYAQGKRTFLNELHEAFDKNPDLRPDMLNRIRGAMELVVGRAQEARVIRNDVSGSDVMQLVGPMCTNATLSEAESRRLLALILDGLRTL
ncbi:MAG TPA: helix-turn-helix domain-containing protein [Acidimicrobiales bacterium]|jgi:AcrR family transcriptional regulator|nr:helix-turn-helix domain-containing protein [Acidimicrobiales bacterium]